MFTTTTTTATTTMVTIIRVVKMFLIVNFIEIPVLMIFFICISFL